MAQVIVWLPLVYSYPTILISLIILSAVAPVVGKEFILCYFPEEKSVFENTGAVRLFHWTRELN